MWVGPHGVRIFRSPHDPTKRALEFVHTLGAIGVTGALAAGLVLLAAMRVIAVANIVLATRRPRLRRPLKRDAGSAAP